MSDWMLDEPAEHDPSQRPLVSRNITYHGSLRAALEACDAWGAQVRHGSYRDGVVHLTVDVTTRDVETWFKFDDDMLFYGPA